MMKMFHGTNKQLLSIKKGSWVTSDRDTALFFAKEKVSTDGGTVIIYEFEIDDNDIDWDYISACAGVDDERGVLICEVVL